MPLTSAPGAVPHNLGRAIEALRDKAGAIIAFGALVFLLGAAALAFSFTASLAAITINGVFFALAGAAEIALGMRSRDWGRFAFWIVGGALYVFVGLVCVFRPMFSLQILTLLFGAGLVAAGLVRAVLIAGVPIGQSRLPGLLGAAVTILLGAVILAHWPLDSLWVLGTILGVDLLFHGAGWVAFGMALRARR
jgi:uncharacterized membrane protein HdeD (DUF308 family)